MRPVCCVGRARRAKGRQKYLIRHINELSSCLGLVECNERRIQPPTKGTTRKKHDKTASPAVLSCPVSSNVMNGLTFNKNRTRRKLLSVPNKVFCCRFVRAVPTQRAFCCGACPPLRAWAHSHRSSTATRTPTLMTRVSSCRSAVPGCVAHWLTWQRRRNRCCWAVVACGSQVAWQGLRLGLRL